MGNSIYTYEKRERVQNKKTSCILLIIRQMRYICVPIKHEIDNYQEACTRKLKLNFES